MALLLVSLLAAAALADDAPADNSADYRDWKHSASFWLLTTPEGVELPASALVRDFPVVLRLDGDSFDFSQALSDGADVRFATAEGQRLDYQIEEWNAKERRATLWIRVPEIRGNARRELKIFWGNPRAVSESSGAAVFSPANGFASVVHLHEQVVDEVGTLTCRDSGTVTTPGIVGMARRFALGKGIAGGTELRGLPSGANPHTTEAWFRADQANATLVGWGNEQAQGKVVMQFRGPPHIQLDCYFSNGNVRSDGVLPRGEWTHVVHSYEDGVARVFINGALAGENRGQGAPLRIQSPARFWLGGWYDRYDFSGELDEVRVSNVARSADWIKLSYGNQRPLQRLVGCLVTEGNDFSLTHGPTSLTENQPTIVSGRADGAQLLTWRLRRGDQTRVLATNRLQVRIPPARVSAPEEWTLFMDAVFPDGVRSLALPLQVADTLPDPVFRLVAPASWDGRYPIEIVPVVENDLQLRLRNVNKYNYRWSIEGMAVSMSQARDRLVLRRAHDSGPLRVTLDLDNGGEPARQTVVIEVAESAKEADPWKAREVLVVEQPVDHQFIPREGYGPPAQTTGTLVYSGRLNAPADGVFLRLYADEQLRETRTAKLGDDLSYSLRVPIQAGLVKYRTEFGTRSGEVETKLHEAADIVCGDAYLICGQSNAVATDFGQAEPPASSPWIRTFGATDSHPAGSRLELWGNAVARAPGGKLEIGYWGMDLARRLVERHQVPICILNGAVGGTRIDQHQRHAEVPTSAETIYGRLLWRARQARIDHGVRAVFWHQGENDQGADGPTGDYGHENYRDFFVKLASNWKEDYPNLQHYYVFQIWPKACAMGVNGSDNRLREVQRRLADGFHNLSLVATVGVKPPGGCHFPAAGYAEFARLVEPLVARDIYSARSDRPVSPPNLRRAYFTKENDREIVLEFDQPVVWKESLAREFYLDGQARQVVSGAAEGKRLTLQLRGPSRAGKVTYLDSAQWSPDNLLVGENGLAALTFWEVPIQTE